MKSALFKLLIIFCLSLGAGAMLPLPYSAAIRLAQADEPWRAEFDDLCGKSQQAMEMSVAELQKLLERCDKLKPQIDALEASPRKVFLKRLQLCRDLYAYVLESKSAKGEK